MEFRKNVLMTLRDYMNYNYFHAKKRLMIPALFCLIAATVSLLIMGINRGDENIITTIIVFYIIFGLITFLFILSIKSTTKKQYESSILMKTETEIVINEAGISESNEMSSTNIRWPDIYQAAESKTALYVFISKLQASVIPKRLITADEELVIRSLIKNYLAPEKNRLKK